MEQTTFIQRLQLFIVTYKKQLLILFAVIASIAIVSQFGIIKVSVENPSGNNPVSVSLLNQGSLKSSGMKFGSSGWRIVRSGSYEVTSIQDNRSAFSLQNVRGFLLPSSVSQKLVSEDAAEFIGYNPDACVHYNGNFAMSWGCISGAAALTQHKPAEGRQPTVNIPNPQGFVGTVQGIFTFKDKTYMLLRDRSGGEDNEGDAPPRQMFYELDANYNPVRAVRAQGLDSVATYQVAPLEDKFLVYTNDRTKFYTFSSIDSAPEQLDIKNPDSKVLRPSTIRTSGDSIYVLYVNYEIDIGQPAPEDIQNRIVVYRDGKATTIQYNEKSIDDFDACSGNICILQDQTLGVYGVSGDQLDLRYQIKQVDSIAAIGDTLLVSKPQGTLDLRTNEATGHYGVLAYDTQSCGIRYASEDNYVICTQETTKNKRKGLLNISLETESSNNILKQVKQLESQPEISAVSVYKNGIIVSPNYGKRSFNEETGTYTFNPETVKKVSEKVKQQVADAKIDTTKYTVTILPAL